MKPPPHVCSFCGFRATFVTADTTAYYFRCDNCGTHGTEPRR